MKRAFLWLIQSFFYLIPAVLIVAGIYIFVRFIPNYRGNTERPVDSHCFYCLYKIQQMVLVVICR